MSRRVPILVALTSITVAILVGGCLFGPRTLSVVWDNHDDADYVLWFGGAPGDLLPANTTRSQSLGLDGTAGVRVRVLDTTSCTVVAEVPLSDNSLVVIEGGRATVMPADLSASRSAEATRTSWCRDSGPRPGSS